MKILTLLTDFGTSDYYVGAVKGTILRLAGAAAPAITVVDLSHEIAPGDVAAGAFVLAAAARSFPAGSVHLAVVDPGVGSARRILAAEHDGSFYVGPDNGLLGGSFGGRLGGALDGRVVAVERGDLYLEAPGDTFHGRDRFAPVAAALLRGEALGALGPACGDPVRLPHAPPRRDGRRLSGTVIHVDRFGNLVTDLPSGWLGSEPATATVGEHAIDRLASCYADIPDGAAALIPGSLGTLEVSMRGTSVAERWQIRPGARVEIGLR